MLCALDFDIFEVEQANGQELKPNIPSETEISNCSVLAQKAQVKGDWYSSVHLPSPTKD